MYIACMVWIYYNLFDQSLDFRWCGCFQFFLILNSVLILKSYLHLYFLRIDSYQWICHFLGLYCPLERCFSFTLSPLWNESHHVWYTLDNSMHCLLLILVKLVDKIVVWWSFFMYFLVNCLYFCFVFFFFRYKFKF